MPTRGGMSQDKKLKSSRITKYTGSMDAKPIVVTPNPVTSSNTRKVTKRNK